MRLLFQAEELDHDLLARMHPILTQFSSDFTKELLATFPAYTYEQNEAVFLDGDETDSSVWLIFYGSVMLQFEGSGTRVRFDRIIGEEAVDLKVEARGYSAVAKEETKLLKVNMRGIMKLEVDRTEIEAFVRMCN